MILFVNCDVSVEDLFSYVLFSTSGRTIPIFYTTSLLKGNVGKQKQKQKITKILLYKERIPL